jgi:Zn finger protein HypA/HybF involved in hydrogenase expression
MSAPAAYHCNTCGHLASRTQLRSGEWGDLCCPACGSPDLERYRTRFERWYAILFLYKVY